MTSVDVTAFRKAHHTPAEPVGTILRFVLTLVGVSMVVAAFGLWLVPGQGQMPELILTKLGLSLFSVIGGLCSLAVSQQLR